MFDFEDFGMLHQQIEQWLPGLHQSDGVVTAAGTLASYDDIYVTGTRLYPSPGIIGSSTGTTSYTGGSSSYGDGGSQDPTVRDVHATPCVETSFLKAPGATLTESNTAAWAGAFAIADKNEQSYEYSVIVYSLNGQVGYTKPYTDFLYDKVNALGGIHSVPTGAVIIGIEHNHPDLAMQDNEWQPSAVDWSAWNQVVNYNANHAVDLERGITVDPNMLMYIFDCQDGNVYVYDKTDKTQTTPSCTL